MSHIRIISTDMATCSAYPGNLLLHLTLLYLKGAEGERREREGETGKGMRKREGERQAGKIQEA